MSTLVTSSLVLILTRKPLELYTQAKELFQQGGFNLQKFQSGLMKESCKKLPGMITAIHSCLTSQIYTLPLMTYN